ncbi:uncharacterized protein LOC115455727 [Manduca sexta]|uniref:MADF domain-containing protein n=1 Tax=Manduca sexta TaxID=7130 RepID=A0A921YPK5_MANSE|nr:uncharacterized protein LOC115455727 [Manduca sexta]KAG6443054.1 hypothetical protein O3G_MSEX002668 [Manduca sexta]
MPVVAHQMLARVDVRAMSVAWSNDRVLQLIELYQNCGCLWDSTDYDYKNKLKKRDAWNTISKILDLPLKEVESKIHTLRSQFTRERKKLKSSNKPGCAITWFAYEPLQFLLKCESSASGKESTLNQIDDSSFKLEAQLDEEQDSHEFQQTENAESRPKKRRNEEKINDAYKLMMEAKKLRNEDCIDEFDVYGKYVASELRNIRDEYSTLIAKQHINNILIDARFGKYRQEYSSFGYNTVHASDPLTSHLSPVVKIEERSHSVNSEQDSQQSSVHVVD